jgi:predicted nucleic acid-binding protein
VAVVADASLLVALIARDSRSEWVSAWFLHWFEHGTDVHVPELSLYEVASGITRLVAAGAFPAAGIAEAWEQLDGLPLIFHPLSQGPHIIELALTLGRTSAYDAAYLALGEELRAEAWTLDGRFARNASARGFSVRLVEDGVKPPGKLDW